MAYLAKIQYKYNDLLEDAREGKPPVLADFKKAMDDAIKSLPPDAKSEIKFNSLSMLQHLAVIVDDYKKNDLHSVKDDLTYYFVFNDSGKAIKIPTNVIRSTIEEMPRLVRHSKSPDVAPSNRFQDTETTDTFLFNREASPEADIQNLYEDFVGQINANLASIEDMMTYPEMLSELYGLIRTQIPSRERPHILKKLNEMISQLNNLILQKTAHPNKRYTISPIDIRDTTKGLYAEEYSSGTKMMEKKQPTSQRKRIKEDEPIHKMDVVDFFEHIPSDYVSGKQTIVQQKPQGLKRRNTQEDPKPAEMTDSISGLKRALKNLGTDYTSNQFIDDIPAMEMEEVRDFVARTAEPSVPKRRGRKPSTPMQLVDEDIPVTPPKRGRKPSTRVKKAKDVLAEIPPSKWKVVDLKAFMKERKIKGISGKKPQLVAIVSAYLNQDDEL